MKKPIHFLAVALVLGSVTAVRSQDSETAKPAAVPAVPAVFEPSVESVPAEKPAPVPVSVFSAETLKQLGIGPNAKVVSVMTNRLDVLDKGSTRLEGGLVPLIKQPSLVTFLQLFNPFAPEEYGGMGAGRPDQGFSRAFADPIKTQPAAALISFGDRPRKAQPANTVTGD